MLKGQDEFQLSDIVSWLKNNVDSKDPGDALERITVNSQTRSLKLIFIDYHDSRLSKVDEADVYI